MRSPTSLFFAKWHLPVEQQLSAFGAFLIYLAKVSKQAFCPPFRRELFIQQLEFIGNQSLTIILLTGFATGAVFGLQIGGVFSIFKAEGMIGGATGIALASELAPLVTAFLLTGRAGAAMTAEIATMVVHEQVDALEAMGVDPLHYLVVPRLLASLLAMPLLCGLFMFVGVVGVYAIGGMMFRVDEGLFWDKLLSLVSPEDVVKGLQKMFLFAFAIATIACRQGLAAAKGAEGVGIATTTAVVKTLLVILFTDFIISYIQLRWLS